MSQAWIHWGFVGVIGALASYCCWILSSSSRPPWEYETADATLKVMLQDIKNIWTSNSQEVRQVKLQHLARAWRSPEMAAEVQPDPELRYEPLAQFWERSVRTAPYFRGALVYRRVVSQLLEILDREGAGPSVVRVNPLGTDRDPEAGLPDPTFAILSHTSLRDHSLGLARHVIQQLTEEGARHIIPIALVAALAHDVGKLPSQRKVLAHSGDHSTAAGLLLEKVSGFSDLPHATEILAAIKQHHGDPKDRLGKLLANAEKAARLQEYKAGLERASSFAPALPTAPEPATEKPEPDAVIAAARPPLVPPIKGVTIPGALLSPAPPASSVREPPEAGEIVPSPASPPEVTSEPPPDAREPRAVPAAPLLGSWFNEEELLGALVPYFNRLQGVVFETLTMPTGHVYVKPTVLEKALRAHAADHGVRLWSRENPGSPTMQAVLLEALDRLWNAGAIDPSLMHRGTLAAKFAVETASGARTTLYVPLRAKAFASWGMPSEFEEGKKKDARRVNAVRPA